MKIVLQNQAIRDCHEFDLRSHKGLEVLILATTILLLTRVILH